MPTLVQGALLGAKVIELSAGYSHTACITEQGALYTWGYGKHGVLGHGTRASVNVPNLVQGALLGAKVIQISTGNRHTACITEQGALYTWGSSADGKLGHGNEFMVND